MAYFVGYDGLQQAIAASAGSMTYSMANAEIQSAYAAAGLNGVKQLAGEYGISFVTYADKSTPAWWVVQSMEGATPTAAETLYPAVLDTAVNSGTGEVVFSTAKQVATENGLKVLTPGAIKTATTALSVVGAIATGAQLGWESYKEHPDFWTDLSESIFNSSDPDTPIEVLARAHSGGYTTAIKEEKLCGILQKMAEQGCFDYQDYVSTIEHEGLQDVTWSAVGAAGSVSALAMNKASELYPGMEVIQTVEMQASATQIQGYAYIKQIDTLPSSAVVTAVEDQGKTYYYVNVACYEVGAYFDTETSSVVYYDYGIGNRAIYSGVSGDVVIGGLSVNIIEYEADNELFTNDHSGNALSIAPTFSLSEIAQAVRDKFLDWFGNSWIQKEYDPETGQDEDKRYYPITIPWWNPTKNPNKDPNFDPTAARSGDIEPDSDPRSEPQGDTATQNNPKYDTDPALEPTVPTPPPAPTPTDPGAGEGGSATGLWAVYNPTVTELNSLGAYLWTNNIIELLQKFLQNPMDAIISLHRLYALPSTGAPAHIMLGYLDSGVSANVVTDQFITVNCGSVNVPEYFSDARDYDAPYTVVEAYLPFIGIVRLRTEDIIGGSVNIVYEVDAYSGACLCKIFVTKLGAKQLLYTYSGNCSMQIPLTGGDRTRLLSGALTGAVAGAAVSGPVGAVVGAVGGAFKGGASVDRCGGFSANAACMGVKKPYLIITRKYAYDAGSYNSFYGYPSNVTVPLSSCSGYTRVKAVHIDSMGVATDSEVSEIETLLRQGVIIK